MKVFLNYTPHAVKLNDGTEFPSMGVARVSNTFTEVDADGICNVVYGDVTGLPEPREDTMYIVSAMVKNASNRTDLVAPATGHPDCVRNDKGFIVSVPCLVK